MLWKGSEGIWVLRQWGGSSRGAGALLGAVHISSAEGSGLQEQEIHGQLSCS